MVSQQPLNRRRRQRTHRLGIYSSLPMVTFVLVSIILLLSLLPIALHTSLPSLHSNPYGSTTFHHGHEMDNFLHHHQHSHNTQPRRHRRSRSEHRDALVEQARHHRQTFPPRHAAHQFAHATPQRQHIHEPHNNDDRPITYDIKTTILVVGGSDGSGTRAFVQALGQLGVPMLVDDPQTLDMHASELFHGGGWPVLVQLVLNATHTADYDWALHDANSLSTDIRDQAEREWSRLHRIWSRRAHHLRTLFSNTGTLPRNVSTLVDYGFKAPVSMILLPLLTHFYGRVKFLHVVRDGRDVALSKNQSPTAKFYDGFYPDHQQRRDRAANTSSVLAMDLWNDWNIQVHNWCQHNTHLVDSLVVRTEDLLHHKHDTLRRMAKFVGSTRSKRDICCLAHADEKDLGGSVLFHEASSLNNHRRQPGRRRLVNRHNRRHNRNRNGIEDGTGEDFSPIGGTRGRTDDTTLEKPLNRRRHNNFRRPHGARQQQQAIRAAAEKEEAPPLDARFGKWKTALQDNPSLLESLEQHGHEGLMLFGYKPYLDAVLFHAEPTTVDEDTKKDSECSYQDLEMCKGGSRRL